MDGSLRKKYLISETAISIRAILPKLMNVLHQLVSVAFLLRANFATARAA